MGKTLRRLVCLTNCVVTCRLAQILLEEFTRPGRHFYGLTVRRLLREGRI